MIWIIGEYADRIENADELLESFLEAFPEETSGVQLQLVTATVKLFLKRPTERVQQMIQLVLTFATQVRGCSRLTSRLVGSCCACCHPIPELARTTCAGDGSAVPLWCTLWD